MRLERERAVRALEQVAVPLSHTVEATAQGIVDIAVAHINRCVRLVSVQRGYDPKDYVLYAYGGMGPVVGALVADEMTMTRVVVPPHPGLFSAVGLLAADLTRVYRQTGFAAVTSDAPAVVAGQFARLRAAAADELACHGYPAESIAWSEWLEMRYRGQGFELTVPIDLERLAAEGRPFLERLFHEAHRTRYRTAVPTDHIEIVTYGLVARVPGQRDLFADLQRQSAPARTHREDRGCVTFGGTSHICPFVWRESLARGHEVRGLALVEEPTATTFVPPGWTATVASTGALVLEKDGRS
jgi:N-methylhydantoinase A